MSGLLNSPIAQGLLALLVGGALIAVSLVKGLDSETKGALLAAGLSALTYGGSRLGSVPTETRMKEALINQDRVESKVDTTQALVAENTSVTVEAAEAARLAAEAAVKRDMRH